MSLIKGITCNETYLIRQSVLRIGKPIESCHFDGDDLPSTKHFGFIIDDKMVGIVSLFEKSNPLFKNEFQYQIRGMAILKDYQKNGIGRALMLYIEQHLDVKFLIWFNARESAIDFYKKLGYTTAGSTFMIDGVGFHIVMYNKKAL